MSSSQIEFPGTFDQLYLNTPACGLISQKTHRAIVNYHTRYLAGGSLIADDWIQTELENTRNLLANFVNANNSELALVPNFSFAYNALLDGLGKKKVVVYERDYPSLLLPLKLKGFELTYLKDTSGFEIDYDQLFDTLKNSEAEMLVISHVQYRTGFLLDLKVVGEYCHQNQIIFIVDATQSAGAYPLNFSELNVDALIWSNYKWMNAGFGNGVLCVKNSLLEQHSPTIGGFGSYELKDNEWSYSPSIKSFEPSHPNMPALCGLTSSIKEIMVAGVKLIREHNLKLTLSLIERLNEEGINYFGNSESDSFRNFIVIPATIEEHQYFMSQKVITTFREGYIRLGFHKYNESTDVDRFMAVLIGIRD